MTHYPLIVWPDQPTSDRQYVEMIALNDCRIRAEQFVLVEGQMYHYFLKIDERPVNFSPTLARDDPATFSALVKKLQGDIKTTSVEQHNLLHYRGRLLACRELATDTTSEVLTAPELGSPGRLATDDESIAYLSLPPMDPALRFAHIFNMTIPLCNSLALLCHHFLMTGATGQGKSTAITNLIAAAYALGATVFVFDFKPDYQHIEEVSTFRAQAQLPGIAREHISYWNLNVRRPYRGDVMPVNVHFSEIEAGIYAALCAARDNDQMRHVFHELIMMYGEKMHQAGKSSWSFAEFFAAIPKGKGDAKIQDFYGSGETPHDYTLQATARMRSHKPSWVDRVVQGRGAFKRSHQGDSFFEHPAFLSPQHIHVVQVAPAKDSDYGLFLTTMMEHISERKEVEDLKHPILIIMDEAEDIFAGSDFAKACTGEIAGLLRKGRSQDIGLVVSVQSASNIPAPIANNLHSTIAFGHNSEEAAGHVKKLLGADARNLQSLGKGDAIIKLLGAKTAVRAKLDRGAFRLVGTK
jgi:hypothetical protein